MDYIDHYKIVAKIGEGGMGDVYQAFEEELQREVAIKFLKPESHANEERVQRFKQEAIALAKMNHSNIAAVYKFGRLNNNLYIVMEFVKGETLTCVLDREGVLPVATAIQYTLEILEGLNHAHDFNIIHRDIKPANLIITEKNTVKILDFGIARMLDLTTPSSKTRYAIGTSDYMSPEQIKVGNIDERSDIYSVGVVLYQMLTGYLPFRKDSEYALQQAHVNEKPKSPRIFSDDVPLKIANLVLKALEKQPEKRFANTGEFSAALQKQLLALPSNKQWFYRIKQFCFDYPAVILLAFLMFAGGAIALNNTAYTAALIKTTHRYLPAMALPTYQVIDKSIKIANADPNNMGLNTFQAQPPANKEVPPQSEDKQSHFVPASEQKTKSKLTVPIMVTPKKSLNNKPKLIKHHKALATTSSRSKCQGAKCSKIIKKHSYPRETLHSSKYSNGLGIVRGVHDAY